MNRFFMTFVGAVQVNGEENFKHLPVITEAWNLGQSILIFTEHTDEILRCMMNLVKKSL